MYVRVVPYPASDNVQYERTKEEEEKGKEKKSFVIDTKGCSKMEVGEMQIVLNLQWYVDRSFHTFPNSTMESCLKQKSSFSVT